VKVATCKDITSRDGAGPHPARQARFRLTIEFVGSRMGASPIPTKGRGEVS